MSDASTIAQDDLAELLRILGMGDHARPQSPHEVFQEALGVLRKQLAEHGQLREEARSWRAVAERLEVETQDLLHACDCEIRDQTNNRTTSDKQSAAYAEGALRVANGIAARIRDKSVARG